MNPPLQSQPWSVFTMTFLNVILAPGHQIHQFVEDSLMVVREVKSQYGCVKSFNNRYHYSDILMFLLLPHYIITRWTPRLRSDTEKKKKNNEEF